MSDFKRRNPRQLRARNTVASILEATAQLLDRTYVVSLTTNHVAERAGVSIGTLYQYFNNKDEILYALARKEITATRVRAQSALMEEDIVSGRDLIDRMSSISITTFENRPIVRKNIRDLLGDEPSLSEQIQMNRIRLCKQLEQRLIYLEPEKFRTASKDERLCFVSAWSGVINQTLEENIEKHKKSDIKNILSGTLIGFFERRT